MKTGYTVMSGFNLVSSVVRDNAHVIGVVMGGRTAHMRDSEMMRLLNHTFARIEQPPDAGRARRSALARRSPTGRKPNTIIAGFDIGARWCRGRKRAGTIASAAPDLRPADAVDPNDEDAAETRGDPDDDMIADLIAPNCAAPEPRPKVDAGLLSTAGRRARGPPPAAQRCAASAATAASRRRRWPRWA